MRDFLICSLIILASIATVTSFCTDVSHNDCRAGSVEREYDVDLEVCHSLCSTFHNAINACNFYRHKLGNVGYTCFHYAPQHFSDYYKDCGAISAPRNVDETCLNPPEDTCYVTQSSRCVYKGTLLESSVADDQEFCRSLCDTEPNCQRWVFYKESKRCERLDSAEQDCQNIFGPPSKTPNSCSQPASTPQPGTTTTPQPLPKQCSDYMVLDNANRNERDDRCGMNDKDGCYCDVALHDRPSPDWQGKGYYRFIIPAGTKMAESNPGNGHCGATFPGYLADSHPTEVGVEKEMKANFSDFGDEYSTTIFVTLCSDFYVYYLDTPSACDLRYCGSN